MLQAILIGIWAGICGIDQFDFTQTLHRPIISGLVIGLILGDLKTGLIVGGTLELVWMGLVPLAGAQPPNIVVGGVVGVSIAILSNLDPNAAVGIAFPFAVVAQLMVTLMFTLFSPIMHYADKMAEEGNTQAIANINYLQALIRFLVWGGIAFLVVYAGADNVAGLVNLMPEKLIGGFGISGGMMTAVGFALLLNIMFKIEYLPFLIIGFVLSAYLHLDILSISLLGIAIAMYDFYMNGKSGKAKTEEVYDDGI